MKRISGRNIDSKINTLYVIIFLLNLHIAIPAYINSTFLSTFVSNKLVGIIYTIGSILTVSVFIFLPKLLGKYGNYKVGITTLILEFITIFILAITREPILLFISFILSLILTRIAIFNIDIFLESYSSDEETGGIRGFFLSSSNLAWVISPLIGGLILANDNYLRLYLVSAFILIPTFFIVFHKFRNFDDLKYDKVPFWGTVREIVRKPNVRKIIMSNIMLRFFYSWMVIYAPIYLHEHIGFEWSEIGLIFTIMLLPFILFEIPLGKIADKLTGEKELLSLGLIIMAISAGLMPFINGGSIFVWAGLLFITRTGASMVEVMTETYFFKKIDGTDSNLLSFFRMTSPIAYIFSPILATIILPFIGIQYIFLVLGIIMLFGLFEALTLKDTL